MRSILVCFVAGFVVASTSPAQNSATAYAFWTFAGRAGFSGTSDGIGSNARFNRPWGIAVDGQGNVYVTEAVSHVLRKISPDGVVTTLAGRAGEVGSADGLGTEARFASLGTNPFGTTTASAIGPFGIAMDSGGNGFVADGNSHTLRRFTPAGLVTTFSGIATVAGFLDGPAGSAVYRLPVGLAIDAAGNIFVADTYNHVVRRVSPNGAVSTIAGSAGAAGTADGLGSVARFLHPTAIAFSSTGNLFVADSNNTIRRLSPTGSPDVWSVATLAGSAFTWGTNDGIGAEARFGTAPIVSPSGGQTVSFPSFSSVLSPSAFVGTSYRLGDLPGLAADGAGNVYVSDFSNNTIRRITPAGVVTTIGGTSAPGVSDGLGANARFQRPCGIAVDTAGTLYIADSLNHTIRKAAFPSPPVVQAHPSSQTANLGANVVLTASVTGNPTPTFQWSRNNVPISGATTSTLTLNNILVTQAGTYSATVTNVVGSTYTNPAEVTVLSPPVITTQPSSQSVLGGATVTLTVAVAGFPTPTYQWQRNGEPIPGQTSASLALANAQEEHGGDYRVVVTNSLGTTTSGQATVVVRTGRIVNLSIRSALGASDPLIAGFVVSGGSKSLLIRAVGPTLRQFGVNNAMPDPQLTLQAGSTVLSTNDNWFVAANSTQLAVMAAQVGAFALPAGSLDAAALETISNIPVTAQTSARNNVGGVVLLELFDTGAASVARLVNVSTRAQVGIGENALFAGFVLGGNSPRRLLIRAVGPTLGAFGVPGTLADPVLEIFTAGAAVALTTNDNWNGEASLIATFPLVGAFPLPSTASRDAALVILLEPGSYSARVSGIGNTMGEVLFEIYEVP